MAITNEYDETFSQLRRRLPLGSRVRHADGWEGTVVGWEYGQVGIKVDASYGTRVRVGSGRVCFCYGRNVTAHSEVVREWARAHGLNVSDRGRVAADVVRQFEEATGRAVEEDR